jgi:hypothetical protein
MQAISDLGAIAPQNTQREATKGIALDHFYRAIDALFFSLARHGL